MRFRSAKGIKSAPSRASSAKKEIRAMQDVSGLGRSAVHHSPTTEFISSKSLAFSVLPELTRITMGVAMATPSSPPPKQTKCSHLRTIVLTEG